MGYKLIHKCPKLAFFVPILIHGNFWDEKKYKFPHLSVLPMQDRHLKEGVHAITYERTGILSLH